MKDAAGGETPANGVGLDVNATGVYTVCRDPPDRRIAIDSEPVEASVTPDVGPHPVAARDLAARVTIVHWLGQRGGRGNTSHGGPGMRAVCEVDAASFIHFPME